MKKVIIIIAALLMVLSGCGVYDSVDLADYTKKELKIKYGEEFDVVYVSNDGIHTTAYSLSNPNVLFLTEYYYAQKKGNDTYRQEKLCAYYKKTAEDILKDFKYSYYLDVDINSDFSLVKLAPDITNEEICAKNTSVLIPEYNWFVSSDSLEMSDEDFYNYINLIANLPIQTNAKVRMFVVSDDYLTVVRDNYNLFSYLEESFLFKTTVDKHFDFVFQENRNGQLALQLEKIKNTMEGIRKNELYR